MIIDERTEFADASTDVQTTTGTANVGDVIDSSVARDLGNGQPVYLIVTVDTEIDSSGDGATVQFSLVSDGTATIATDGNQSIHFLSKAFTESELGAGATFAFMLPVEGLAYERYLGFQVVVGTETVTAGAVNAFLSLNPGFAWKSYADASN